MNYIFNENLREDNHKKTFTISELTRDIKSLLENNFPQIWIEGEISNYKLHSSGHAYFTLKDENAQIRCVMWRNFQMALAFRPEDGMKVLCSGALTLYERSGNYQIKVMKMQPAGVGELQMAFEQLKNKLSAEGLFDDINKKPIPAYTEKVGIVTSPTGAAVRDIISVIQRRAPQVQLILTPVNVQGPGAAEEIAAAIEMFNEYGQVDVLIVGRGGGSLEDLWSFNEEIVARAVFKSKLPVVSAVGHQVDFTISDFVADLRAPTPSAAGELVVKDKYDVSGQVRSGFERINQVLNFSLSNLKEKIKNIDNSYGFKQPENMLLQKSQRIDEIEQRLNLGFENYLERQKNRVESFDGKLKALSPLAVLERGYSIVFQEDKVIKKAKDVDKKKEIDIMLHKGSLKADVKVVNK